MALPSEYAPAEIVRIEPGVRKLVHYARSVMADADPWKDKVETGVKFVNGYFLHDWTITDPGTAEKKVVRAISLKVDLEDGKPVKKWHRLISKREFDVISKFLADGSIFEGSFEWFKPTKGFGMFPELTPKP